MKIIRYDPYDNKAAAEAISQAMLHGETILVPFIPRRQERRPRRKTPRKSSQRISS